MHVVVDLKTYPCLFCIAIHYIQFTLPPSLPPLSLPLGPDIDTPEEKKKKQELALAKQAEEQEQMVAMAARTVNKESDQLSVHSGNSPSSQRSHSSSGGQSDHSSSSGSNGNYHHRYVGRQPGPNAAGNPSPYGEWLHHCFDTYYT